MAKIADVQEVPVADLVPYERNAKQHGADQVDKIVNSIRRSSKRQEIIFLTNAAALKNSRSGG